MRISVGEPHASHQRRSWISAPATESTSDPTTPPTTTHGKYRGTPRSKTASPPTHIAPASDATVPAAVTPPEVPMGSGRHVRIDLGLPPNRVPISVAHVSAAEAVSAPVARTKNSSGG